MRLIDADAIGNPYENTSLAFEFMVLKKILDDAPTVDAVEVVRCKNCKEYKYCFLLPNDDDYCSKGERKNDD